jgi:hypothetical protein
VSKYNRIKLELIDISPQSVSKVFLFLQNCFDNNLSPEYYKTNIINYSIYEQYFIVYYAKQYFSDSRESHLNKSLKKIANEYGDIYNNNPIEDYFYQLQNNAKTLLAILNQAENTISRQAKKSKKGYFIVENHSVYNYRIPFYLKHKIETDNIILKSRQKIDIEIFKRKVEEIISPIMDSKQFEEFFNNSFDFHGNLNSPQLLNIEMGNVKEVYCQFYKLYSYFKIERNDQTKIINDHYNKLIEDKTKKKDSLPKNSIRIKFIKIPEQFSLKKVTRIDVMKIMYNTFPQIRDSYFQHQNKNPNSTLDLYINTISRNIKNA